MERCPFEVGVSPKIRETVGVFELPNESLTQSVMTYCDVDRAEAQLRITEARWNVYALIEQAHERNSDVPPDVIDALVEKAREATPAQQ